MPRAEKKGKWSPKPALHYVRVQDREIAVKRNYGGFYCLVQRSRGEQNLGIYKENNKEKPNLFENMERNALNYGQES